MNVSKPVIGISMGDPAGIGPEIVVKSLSVKEIYERCLPVVIGDAAVLTKAAEFTRSDVEIHPVREVSEAEYTYGIIDVIDLHNVDIGNLHMGTVSARAGDAAFEAVKKVIELALRGDVDATVTGPINKEAINKAGHHFSGHTEIYAHYTGTKNYAMLLVHGNLRVIHVTTHVSLREACDLVRRDRILTVIKLLHDACRRFGIKYPKIGVAALNPHASDGGLFGWEEEREILPAVREAQDQGMNVEGPVPSDTLFSKAKGGLFDGCVAMYHDQGHIPFKLEGFRWNREKTRMESVQGVNITLGLPIIRTSVDHGTAFEIAGKGVASPDAMIHAIQYAVEMANNR